jgi:pimeloyl-ACP methyl ester carboxylesterase
VGALAGAGVSVRPRLARVAASAWILAGLLALAWPGITVLALALVTGCGLLVGGLAKVRAALAAEGEERLLAGVTGAAAILAGAVALAWPSISVLALAVVLGARTFLFGCTALAMALRPARPARGAGTRRAVRVQVATGPRPISLTIALAVLALVLVGTGVSVALHQSGPDRPGPFYAAPTKLPRGPAGTLIRSQLIPDFYPGAKAYRVLYRSTGFDGRPTAVSGVIVVPEGPAPRGGRRVIAFTHGTVGIASRCAPSLHASLATQVIGGLGNFLAAGYVVAATDYAGLGTPGPSAYLIGQVEGMNALDSVRAAHRLRAAHAGSEFAIWGHSQGGQAALFAAQLAGSYAPGLHLVGVAAGAPVPDLPALFAVNSPSPTGRALIAMTLVAWEQVYRDPRIEQILPPSARAAAATVAGDCLYSSEPLSAIPGPLLQALTLPHPPHWRREPWRTIVLANTPGREPISVPVLLTQGGSDQIVPPALTVRLARRLCARGERVELRLYPSLGHPEAGIVVAPDVAAWVAERFAGRTPPSTCP